MLTDHYPSIAAFGGMFLLLVFLNFLFDNERQLHWLGPIERMLAKLGKADAYGGNCRSCLFDGDKVFLALRSVSGCLVCRPWRYLLYLLVDSVDALFKMDGQEDGVMGPGSAPASLRSCTWKCLMPRSHSMG